MFWRVAGFSQPSPIELLLDREEFTLEDLLDEEEVIQEAKALNGRLVAFLRERSTVEQLVRYLVDPPLDADDPKRAFKYPFTACEVLCCEVEAVFNTLLEDAELMRFLFSLLDSEPPLNCKTAGYFGRVVGHLLLRKTNEMMQYLQDHPELLQQLVRHVYTTSIAEIIKRLVGADEQSSMLFLSQNLAWLADTPLIDLLLGRLADDATPLSADAQANAADILCAIAHTQPSPLANKLTSPECVKTLFQHALSPGQQVLVSALDVCIALLEPRRSAQSLDEPPMMEAAQKAKAQAVDALVQYIPNVTEILDVTNDDSTTQEAPYGLLNPPLGRARLKAVELLAVLMRSCSPAAEAAIMQSGAIKVCLQLFASYPFNNLLHHCVAAMLMAVLGRADATMLTYIFQECKLLDWLVGLPTEIKPAPLPGKEEQAACKPLLRAGYLGHVTQIASTLESFLPHQQQGERETEDHGSEHGSDAQPAAGTSPSGGGADYSHGLGLAAQVPEEARRSIAGFLEGHGGWQSYQRDVLQPRQELENTSRWACGRPTATELGGMDSDGDEYQAEMELEHMVGMQPVLYHRYHEDEGEEEDEGGAGVDGDDDSELFHNTAAAAATGSYQGSGRPAGMEDDNVLMGSDDEEEDGSPTPVAEPSPMSQDDLYDPPKGLVDGSPNITDVPSSPGQPSAESLMVDCFLAADNDSDPQVQLGSPLISSPQRTQQQAEQQEQESTKSPGTAASPASGADVNDAAMATWQPFPDK